MKGPTVAAAAVLLLLLLGVCSLGDARRGFVPDVKDDWFGWKLVRRDSRFNAFLGHIQFHMLPNFTRVGYELTEGPKDLFERMRANFERYHESAPHEDIPNVVTHMGDAPTFVPNGNLNDELLHTLKGRHEAWSNKSLVASAAYGLRVYHNTNVLKWHVDRIETHVISCIFHVASDLDEPWPLVIANNTGHLNSVSLRPGQMLFYESARLRHARPTPMKGRYYTSVFVHFRPRDWDYKHADALEWLPHDWDKGTIADEDATKDDEDLERRIHREDL